MRDLRPNDVTSKHELTSHVEELLKSSDPTLGGKLPIPTPQKNLEIDPVTAYPVKPIVIAPIATAPSSTHLPSNQMPPISSTATTSIPSFSALSHLDAHQPNSPFLGGEKRFDLVSASPGRRLWGTDSSRSSLEEHGAAGPRIACGLLAVRSPSWRPMNP